VFFSLGVFSTLITVFPWTRLYLNLSVAKLRQSITRVLLHNLRLSSVYM
jgi:hypothetical protein